MIRTHRPIPNEHIKLLIFDLDGTLIDSRQDLSNSVNAMLRQFGRHELPCEIIAGHIGDGAPMLVRRALGDPDDEHLVSEALTYFLSWYREHKLDHTYVYDGILEALRALGAARPQRRMAVLTNKPVVPSRAIIDALGLRDFFFQIYGGNSFHTKKPDPAGVEALLAESGVRREEAVIIGDTEIDVLTARNAEIYSVGVTFGFTPERLTIAAPDVVIDSPEEVSTLFQPSRNQ